MTHVSHKTRQNNGKIPVLAQKIEHWDVAKLRPNVRNARLHSEDQVKQLASSMRQWGWTFPILIDPKGDVIAGHGRLEAAKRLGLERAPVIVARGWTEMQKRAYRVADNRLSENAKWDRDLLGLELGELAAQGFEIKLAGFSETQLKHLLPEDVEDAGKPQLDDGMTYSVIVKCGDEKHQVETLKRLESLGYEVRALIS